MRTADKPFVSQEPRAAISPNVLVITASFPSEPGEMTGNYVLDQALALMHEGASVRLLACGPWMPPGLRKGNVGTKRGINIAAFGKLGLQVHYARYFSLPRNKLGSWALPSQFWALWPTIRKIVKDDAIDVIHAHGEQMAYTASRAAKLLGIKSIVTLHGINPDPKLFDTESKRARLRYGLENANTVVVVGSGSPIQKYFEAYECGRDNVRLITNGVTIPPGTKPSKKIPRSRKLRVAAAGHLHDCKGYDHLIASIGTLDARGITDFEVVCVGGGYLRPKLEAMARERNIADRVRFTGLLSFPEALAEIAAADVFCLPSTWEACGLVYLEAMALGKLTIASEGEGAKDFISHGKTGFLAPRNDVEGLATLLEYVRNHWSESEAIAAAGREYVMQNLTWRDHAKKLIAVYGHQKVLD